MAHPLAGGAVEEGRRRVEDGASELHARAVRLLTGDELEAALLQRLGAQIRAMASTYNDLLAYDRTSENPNHEAQHDLAEAIIRAVNEDREQLRRAAEGELRGLMTRMLGEMERLASASTPGYKTAA